jgi:glycosyltransferase involved in cell wall biosynthesis
MKKILVIHRNYRNKGGEDFFLENSLIPALKACPEFDVRILRWEPLGAIEAFFMALGLEFLRPSFFRVWKALRIFKADHVIFNNFIPTISLKAPWLAKSYGAKTWAWVHNSRLLCANGLTFNGRERCEKCFIKGSRFDLYQNCHKNIFQSLVYSLAYRWQRVSKILCKNIDQFICVSDFTAKTLTLALKASQIKVVRTPPELKKVDISLETAGKMRKLTLGLTGPLFAFVGRISFEKGADRILEIALLKPQYSFLVCGVGPMKADLEKHATHNVVFTGFLNTEEKAWVFQNAAALLITSRVPENAPLIISESQAYGTAVIYPPFGGAEESVKTLGRRGQTVEQFKSDEAFTLEENISPQKSFQETLESLFSN